MSLKTFIAFLIILILTSFADFLLKKSSTAAFVYLNKFFIGGLLIYGFLSFLWSYIYKTMDLSVANIFYSIGVAFISILTGVLAFNESLTISRVVGMFFGIISIYFLNK